MKYLTPLLIFIPIIFIAISNPNFNVSQYLKNKYPNQTVATPTPSPSSIEETANLPSPTITPFNTPTPTRTPTVTTTKAPQAVSDTCTNIPVLTYHHIEDLALAAKEKRTYLSISPQYFRQHLQYLQDHGYTTISPQQLSSFFDNKTPLPPKAVMITFDDGYDDNYTTAFPLLKEFQTKAMIFMITGLINNPGYLSSDQLSELNNSGLVTIGNHTWSHQALNTKDSAKIATEIAQADQQLSDKGLNSAKVFAYPYGATSPVAVENLQKDSYQIAFTTRSGRILCKDNRLLLPRIRPGNADLSKYGL